MQIDCCSNPLFDDYRCVGTNLHARAEGRLRVKTSENKKKKHLRLNCMRLTFRPVASAHTTFNFIRFLFCFVFSSLSRIIIIILCVGCFCFSHWINAFILFEMTAIQPYTLWPISGVIRIRFPAHNRTRSMWDRQQCQVRTTTMTTNLIAAAAPSDMRTTNASTFRSQG